MSDSLSLRPQGGGFGKRDTESKKEKEVEATKVEDKKAELAEISAGPHELRYEWTMFWDEGNNKNKWDPKNNKPVLTFNTVENFWNLFNNMASPLELSGKSNKYLLFHKGVMPNYEDPLNARGGHWLIGFPPPFQDTRTLNKAWLYLVDIYLFIYLSFIDIFSCYSFYLFVHCLLYISFIFYGRCTCVSCFVFL